MTFLFITILMVSALIIAISTIVLWHRQSGGEWHRYFVGRAIMALFLDIVFILLVLLASLFLLEWRGRDLLYFVLLLTLNFSLGQVLFSIYIINKYPEKGKKQ